MRLSKTVRALTLLPCALRSCVLGATTFPSSPKRGLIVVPTETPADNSIWTAAGSDLTWYYNYQALPTSALAGTSLEFVPMLWGAPASTSDNSFLTEVQGLISGGANISYVMAFNEPDGTSATGGSNVNPTLAAQTWIRVLEPLRKQGVKLVAPAVTGAPAGFTWLASFFTACNGGCTADVMPVHWYGNFDGLASHMGQKRSIYPNMSLWITEYALNDQPLDTTQAFFNTSAHYFDRLDFVTRYSYFGSFRSSKSNVGPNAAMLTGDGKLTDIGSWYLGGAATNNIPSKNAAGNLVVSPVAVLSLLGALVSLQAFL